MARGFQRQPIFVDDNDRRHLLELLEKMVERYHVVVHAYCLMPNHYHLLLQTPHANASRALHWLNTGYSVWFNRCHGRSGALFQSRYKSILVEDGGGWALSCAVYIHLNPVRIRQLGLDKTAQAKMKTGVAPEMEPAEVQKLIAARLEQLRGYAWSSHRVYTGMVAAPNWLTCSDILARAGKDRPHDAYRGYVEALLGAAEPGDAPEFANPLVLGTPSFQSRARGRVLVSPAPTADSLAWKRLLSFSEVVHCVEQVKGEPWDLFVNRHKDWGRDLALYAARHHGGATLRNLGQEVGVSAFAVGQSVLRFGRKLQKDPVLSGVYSKLLALLSEEKESNVVC